MDRRDFLKNSVLLGLTGAAATAAMSCATTGIASRPTEHTPLDMEAYLSQLDQSLAVIQHGEILGDLRQAVGAPVVRDPSAMAAHESLVRKSLRALTVTGAFIDLEESERLHPGMQSRVWGALDDMNEAVTGTAEMLAGLSSTERLALQERLQAPDVLRGAVDALDAKAEFAGLSTKRRRHLRRMMHGIGAHARDEGPSDLIHDFVTRVEKHSRALAARGAQTVDPAASPAPGPSSGLPVMPPPPPPPTESGAPPEQPQPTLLPTEFVTVVPGVPPAPPVAVEGPPGPVHRHWISSGLVTLGVGVGTGGIGAAMLLSGNSGVAIVGAFIGTAGAIGLILGLIFLIIGAVRGST